jgi:gliding motility-associated-like protein
MVPTLRNMTRLLFWLFSLVLPLLTHAQTNEGTRFWFGFMEHLNVNNNTKMVMITAKTATSGMVRVPGQNWSQSFSVAANDVTLISMPDFVENYFSESVRDIGIEVTAEQPVSVYIHQYHYSRSEASVVLPVSALGNEYYVLTYRGYSEQGQQHPSQFVVVGMEDETAVQITASALTEGGLLANQTTTIQLNQGETYLVQSKLGAGDMSGSRVVADKNVNVLSGATWTQVPAGCNFRDNLLEQMPPVSTWGRQFAIIPFANLNYDIVRILAAQNGTAVKVKKGTTTTNYTINAGQFIEFNTAEPTFIEGDAPILVAQYMIGSGCSGHNYGDPSVLIVNSVEQIRDTVTLYSSNFEAIKENYLNIITKTTDLATTTLDGQPFSNFTTINGTITDFTGEEYSFVKVRVNKGPHTLISQGCGLIATAYGYGETESYAYGGGAAFNVINATSLIPPGGCLNDSISFFTGFKAPRHSLQWDFGDGTGSTDARATHTYDQLGTYRVKLFLTDNCLDTKDTIERDIEVTLRQIAAVSGDNDVCIGDTIRLMAADLVGATFTWNGPNQYFSSEQNPVIADGQFSNSGNYSVIGTILGCSTYPATITSTVHPPAAPDLGEDLVYCPNEILFSTTLTPGLFTTYEWSTGSIAPDLPIREPGRYAVTVSDEYGCTGVDSILFTAQCPTKFYVPNVFSPNNDGENDFFEVFSTDMADLQLQIYDRWGNLVFETRDINGRWDGTSQDKMLSAGVYVWVAKVTAFKSDGTIIELTESGNVTLIR